MLGRTVELMLSKDVVVKVWVWCSPTTSDGIVRAVAFDKLKETIARIEQECKLGTM